MKNRKSSTQSGESLSEFLTVRLTVGEKGMVAELARAAGLSSSELGRYAIQRLLALRNDDQPAGESP